MPEIKPVHVIGGLVLLTLVACTAFMTLGAKGDWGFILAFRGRKLAALFLVGYAIAISTVLFQTVTNNRILTPALMGFDALYRLLQTVMVYAFGGLAVLSANAQMMFVLETAVMVGFAAAIYSWLFLGAGRSLHLVMLVGIVLGTLFRSIEDLLKRLIDPNEFSVLADLFFASFNAVETDLMAVSALILGAGTIFAWFRLPKWDVLALGRETAINLGVDHKRETMIVLGLVTIFVSVSTALVGPVTFFGLLVANLAYLLARSHKHIHILPVAALLATIALVGGQTLLERVFNFNTSLSIIIEFVGGLFFIFLLLRGAAR